MDIKAFLKSNADVAVANTSRSKHPDGFRVHTSSNGRVIITFREDGKDVAKGEASALARYIARRAVNKAERYRAGAGGVFVKAWQAAEAEAWERIFTSRQSEMLATVNAALVSFRDALKS